MRLLETGIWTLLKRRGTIPYRDPTKMQDYRNLKLSNTEKVVNETGIVLSHVHLLGSRDYSEELIRAIDKVNQNLRDAQQAWKAKQAAFQKK